MKKKYLLSCLSALAMAFTATAAEQTLTVTSASLGLGGYGHAQQVDETSGITIDAYAMKNTGSGNPIQFSKKGGKGNWLSVSANSNGAIISSITINNPTGTGSLSIYKQDTPYNFDKTTASISEVPGTVVTSSTNVYNINAPYFAAVNLSSNAAYAGSITITYEAGASKEDVTISWAEATANATVGEPFTAPALAVTPEAVKEKVTFSSSHEDIATVDETGKVTPLSMGTTVIRADFAGDDTYKSAFAEYTLSVTDPNFKGYGIVTNAEEIEIGAKYLIVYNAGADSKTISTVANDNNRRQTAVTVAEDKIMVLTDQMAIFTLGGAADAYTFHSTIGGVEGYLGCDTGNNNRLFFKNETGNAYTAKITIAENGNATITFNDGSKNIIAYNAESSLFNCYNSTNAANQSPVTLFKEIKETTPAEPVVVPAPVYNDKSVVVSDGTIKFNPNHAAGDVTVKFEEEGLTFWYKVELAAGDEPEPEDPIVPRAEGNAALEGYTAMPAAGIQLTAQMTKLYVIAERTSDGALSEPAVYSIAADTNINTAVGEIEAAEAEAEYYTLEGIRVAEPTDGIYIVRRAGRTSKVLIRR